MGTGRGVSSRIRPAPQLQSIEGDAPKPITDTPPRTRYPTPTNVKVKALYQAA